MLLLLLHGLAAFFASSLLDCSFVPFVYSALPSGLDCFSIFWFVKRKNALFRQNVDVNYVSNCEFHVNNTSNFPILQSIFFDKMLILYRKCPRNCIAIIFFSKLLGKIKLHLVVLMVLIGSQLKLQKWLEFKRKLKLILPIFSWNWQLHFSVVISVAKEVRCESSGKKIVNVPCQLVECKKPIERLVVSDIFTKKRPNKWTLRVTMTYDHNVV